MTNQERAEKIYDSVKTEPWGKDLVIKWIASQFDEAVREAHQEIAAKQTLVHGASVMLGGKVVTNEELYKQPTDYVKEAYAEGFASAREKAAGIVPTTWLDSILSGPDAVEGKPTDGSPYVEAVLKRVAERIRAMTPDGEK